MERSRNALTTRSKGADDRVRVVADRLFKVTEQGMFLYEVYQWKIDYIAEALIHAIQTGNPISLANNARALVEHVAALVLVLRELEMLEERLHRQNDEKTISRSLDKAELVMQRAYYGKSPKVEKERGGQALHINECIDALRKDVTNIETVYDFLCEYVHPNHGSNALVSTGTLASGLLNPPMEFNEAILDKLEGHCINCMSYLTDTLVPRSVIFIRLKDLSDRCLVSGAKITKVFSAKNPAVVGDGSSKETAIFFPKARTALEAIEFCHRFLQEKGYGGALREMGGAADGYIYDIYMTPEGPMWFKVPMIG